jgi:cellulose biosynthesis protein BcsQ
MINQKGGMGKTKLATHIAGELVLRGYHVMPLNADPQGSALDWTGHNDAVKRAYPGCLALLTLSVKPCTRRRQSWQSALTT